MHQNPSTFYQDSIQQLEQEIKIKKRVRRLFGFSRLTSFLLVLLFVYSALYHVNSSYFILAGFIFLGFIVLTVIDNKISQQYKKLLTLHRLSNREREYLNNNFSTLPDGKEFLKPSHPYALDLDIFGAQSFFQRINRSITTPGKHALVQKITHPENISENILKTQKAISEIATYPDWIQEFFATGEMHSTQEITEEKVNHWLQNDRSIYKPWLKKLIFVSGSINMAFVGIWALGFSYIPFMLLSIFHLLIVALKLPEINATNRHLDKFLQSFSKFRWLLNHLKNSSFQEEKLTTLKMVLIDGNESALHGLNKLSRFADIFDQRLNIVVSVVLNALFMRDILIVQNLAEWKKQYKHKVLEWTQQIAELDVLVSFANYRFNHPGFIFPSIDHNKIFQSVGLRHPHLDKNKAVANDIHLEKLNQFHIITGANMAGKSTYLRTIGLNLVMAMCGLPVPAKSFRFKPVYLFTSMRTTDNLDEGYSYFHAELHRLSILMKETKKHTASFVILDELLKGTNSVDKLNGSLRFLKKIKDLPLSGIVATHDLGLGDLEKEFPDNFKNYCFEIDIHGNEINYTYKIQEGISKHMNATLLMKQMGLI